MFILRYKPFVNNIFDSGVLVGFMYKEFDQKISNFKISSFVFWDSVKE